ncbi:hypothetical protein CN373_09540 [Bacillus cereus]|uniref:Uncharacterized protein n=1 Tax=Bacillus cereus TaxID=1396 RepID=A0AA44QCP3_BACCE|nr:hypothetical protein CN373_09540 [Bacillus cereus]PFN05258.1 hypothetical protein COJ55_18815 [Bacillus cereus]PFO84632.1 hypothetical protein COJ77_04210 [Bacillus cereus]PFR26637.1 hypothetical protein COK19_12350 [Bacillus cereus]PFS04412.1 hypothetical protein COK38_06330 [Bacillus cereus]
MKRLCLATSAFLNFIFGFLFTYVLLWLLITVYSINCLFNGCSDMVGEEWVGIIMGMVITFIISVILFPTIIFTNRKFLHVVRIEKRRYVLVVFLSFVFGALLRFYLRLNHVGPF